MSSHISEARNPCRNGPDERDQVNVQLSERLDQHLGRGVVVADAGHDEVLALGRMLRFGLPRDWAINPSLHLGGGVGGWM